MRFRRAAILLAVLPVATSLGASDTIPERAYDRLRWRLLGPLRAGWALCAAGIPGDDLRVLLAFQREVMAALEQSAEAAAEKERIDSRLKALDANPGANGAAHEIARVREGLGSFGGPGGAQEPEAISGLLGSLETDLKSSDAPPTDP